VTPSVETRQKPSCCFLGQLEAGDGLFSVYAGKEGVAAVESGEHERMNDFFKVRASPYGFNL